MANKLELSRERNGGVPTSGPEPFARLICSATLALVAAGCDRDGNDEIYVMDADGSNQTDLTHDPAMDFRPTCSPDGSRIAFTSIR